jgi:hypothetical protein
MPITLTLAILRLLDGRNYAVLATANPDDSPQTLLEIRRKGPGEDRPGAVRVVVRMVVDKVTGYAARPESAPQA